MRSRLLPWWNRARLEISGKAKAVLGKLSPGTALVCSTAFDDESFRGSASADNLLRRRPSQSFDRTKNLSSEFGNCHIVGLRFLDHSFGENGALSTSRFAGSLP